MRRIHQRKKAEENAALAARASETARDRIKRELAELETKAKAIVDAAAIPAPRTPEMIKAQKKVDAAKAATAAAEAVQKKLKNKLDHFDAAAKLQSWWQKKLDPALGLAIYGQLFDQEIKVASARGHLVSMGISLQAATNDVAVAEAGRQATAKVYGLQIELIGKVHEMLAAAPILARYGTRTLLMYAMEPNNPDFRNLKDIWGIPYAPPPPKLPPAPSW